MARKTGVDAAVVAAVKAWAKAKDPASELAQQRRQLDPLLLPSLVEEIAEVTSEQFLLMLDQPENSEGPEVDFLGMPLSQSQAARVAVWLDEQAPTAEALSLTLEAWSKKLSDGFAVTLASLQGVGSDKARAVGEQMKNDPLAQASKGFQGGADPRTSASAGLRGMLAARAFAKKP